MIKGSRFFPVFSCLLMWLTLHTQYGVAAPAHTALGLQQEDIRVGRVLRSYYVRIPSLVVEDTKPPLVIVLHGGGKVMG
ncbi:hypothetical protein [Vibrio tapetis]|uniref:Uncharacterized protein n=1 Tax=Vibrio tapetis subsp. tapetis TaxID=1671868 RepID=A0A2N8ZD29_9VIBR|nr:hypothetical protein [Vibrio tapetis]SON49802.1 exported protein of unknown function [Vibrio tapetis subsp. tapetis]